MTTLNSLPSIFVPLVGLVFPAIAMTSLFLYVQKTKMPFLVSGCLGIHRKPFIV